MELIYTVKIDNGYITPVDIKYGDKVLATLNQEKKRIDFSVLYPFVQKEMRMDFKTLDGELIKSKNVFIDSITKDEKLGLVLNLIDLKEE